MKITIDSAATFAVALAALVAATTAVHREFVGRTAAVHLATTAPQYVPAWRDAERIGTAVANPAAKVVLVEFGDFECPYCRAFYSSLKTASQRFGPNVGLVFVDFPLPYHRFARPAARAANCAERQGAFGRYYSALYEKQDSLGLRPWTAYAIDAGIGDTMRFLQCVRDAGPLPKVDSGLALGQRFNVRGTPTVMINGWLYANLPADSLEVVIGRAIAGSSDRPKQ